MPLSDAKIRNAKPRKKSHILYDEKGLHLEISPAGGKWWRLKYRHNRKLKRISLGTYPEVTLALARERCLEARKLLAAGVDPSSARKAQKAAALIAAANSFEVTAREWLAVRAPSRVASFFKKKLSALERDVFPYIGNRPIADIKAPELLTVLRRIEGREAVESAHRTRTMLGQVFRYAISTGRCDSDPSRDLRGALQSVRESQRNHFAAVTKPEELAPILRLLDLYRGTLPVRCALKLMPILVVRPYELRTMEWSDIDLDAAEWRFTVSKTNTPHIVPLSSQAVAILNEVKPLTGRGRLVFPSARGGNRPMSDNALLCAMRTLGIPKNVTSGHGFRATFRTLGDEIIGFRVDIMEHQLAHQVKDALGTAYNRTKFLSERKIMMQDWADYLDGLKTPKVLEFPEKAWA
jgi:integrase